MTGTTADTQEALDANPTKRALRAYAEATKGQRCPICQGIESCDHTVRERLLSDLATTRAPGEMNEGHWEDLHRELFDAVMACCDPEDKVCGLHPGPERLELEAVIAAHKTVHNADGPYASQVSRLSLSTTRAPGEGEPTGHVDIAHDGFSGDIIGHYVTREGKRGVVVQQDGTRVVHVYSTKWIEGQI